MEEKIILNGTVYRYRQQYIKEDELWECTFVDDQGKMAETAFDMLVCYDESLAVAKSELEACVMENGLHFGIDNKLVLWTHLDSETQRKMMVLARKIKKELVGEWDTPEGHFTKWRDALQAQTGLVFTKAQYDRI